MRAVFLFFLFLTFSCGIKTAEKKVINEQIILETIDDVIDSITPKGDTSIFIHFRWVDGLALGSIERLKASKVIHDAIDESLLDELSKYANDTCVVYFDDYQFKKNLILEDTPANE